VGAGFGARGRFLGRVREGRLDPVEALVDRSQEEFLFRRKEPEDVGLRNADSLGDHLRRGAVEAMEREFSHGGFEHFSPALVGRVTQVPALLGSLQTSHVVIIH
jgi:hypothetical protein